MIEAEVGVGGEEEETATAFQQPAGDLREGGREGRREGGAGMWWK